MGDEKIVALDDITLDFEREKIYCILGTSGSGKSTLLNMMAGLEQPTKGSVTFKGTRLERLNESRLAKFRQKYVGFVFQSYNLLPNLTALENVLLPLIFSRVPGGKRRKLALDMLDAVGLKNRARHKPSQMSGGQQQRVSIARAFVNMPEIVFADEPTGNLDTKTTFEMMGLMTKMARDSRQTLIIVTHDAEIGVYADYRIYMRDGNIEKIVEKTDDGATLSSQKENEYAKNL
jgi:putative ABC transport system ATP-binding protein